MTSNIVVGAPNTVSNNKSSTSFSSSGSGSSGSNTGNIIENPLNQLASYNYIFTISPLSTGEVNYPSSYRKSPPSGIVLKSGGSGSDKITGEQENGLGIIADLYIDDVEILTLIRTNPDTKYSNATTVNFKVIEPYSMGMFLENIKAAAKSKGFDNHSNAPFLLSVEFIGWDDDGNLIELPELRRMFPIKLIDVRFSINAGGSEYEVKAIAWQDQGFADEVQVAKSTIDIEGRNINEMLQTGVKSLTTLLNNVEIASKGESKANQYVILCPIERDVVGGGGGEIKGATTGGGTSIDYKDIVKVVLGIGEGGLPDVSGDPESEAKEIPGFEMSTSEIGSQLQGYATDDGNVNDIGKSKIAKSYITQGIKYFNRPAFVEDENFPGMFKRNKIRANKEGTRLIFPQGTRIEEIIEEVVLLSEYGRKLQERAEDENGMKTWFRIESNVYVGDGDMAETGDKPKVFLYKVIPYKFNTSSFKKTTLESSGISNLERQVVKSYDYIYTGKNDSIIDFNIDINYAYIASLQSDFTKFATTKVTGSSEYLVESDGDKDPDMELNTAGSEAPEGSGTVVPSSRSSTGAIGGGAKNH